jgi:hypothetical protein
LEGFDDDQLKIAQRIQRLGGDVEFFAADGPLWGGHSYDGAQGCRDALPSLAADAADTARAFRSVFPNAKFIDIEPISNFKETDWVELVASWHQEFAKAFGDPFRALHLDVNWRQPWQDRVAAIVARMRRVHVPVGLICNADPKEANDQTWIDDAREHCDDFDRVTGAPPDAVIFQSWNPRPTRTLPEDAPDSFTHLVLDYAERRGLPEARRPQP